MPISITDAFHIQHASVRRIAIDQPSLWVIAGWQDLRHAPAVSLLYGGAFVLAGYLILLGLLASGLGSLIPMMVAGFLLVAPILAVGFYEVSRRLERKEAVTWAAIFGALRARAPALAGMGLVLMLSLAAWAQVALLIFMMFFHSAPPAVDDFVYNLLTAPNAVAFLAFGTVVGSVIAAIVFAITAVSIPMMLDRDVSAIEAMATSVAAVLANWRVMMGWAATIVVLMGVGVATAFVGLAVTLPLAAYATWHAYQALVD
jgi:uncharacterized membrane protein